MATAAYLLAAAALAGMCLYALYPFVKAGERTWWPGLLHGTAGLAGFALLAVALAGAPPHGESSGAGSFGLVAAVLTGAAAVLGLAAFTARWRRRAPGVLLLGLHATLAVAGLTLLAAYLSVP